MTPAPLPLVTTCWRCGLHMAGPVVPVTAERYVTTGECAACRDRWAEREAVASEFASAALSDIEGGLMESQP